MDTADLLKVTAVLHRIGVSLHFLFFDPIEFLVACVIFPFAIFGHLFPFLFLWIFVEFCAFSVSVTLLSTFHLPLFYDLWVRC